MIRHFYWPTPNGHKTAIMLEEVGLQYEVCPVNILEGDQFDADFVRISPNHRIPAIIDTDGPEGEPYAVFESAAVLMYLAEKTGILWPTDMAQRYRVIQWLMFQTSNVGPIFGQNGYFQGYCPEDVPLARERYHNMTNKLYGVMDSRLEVTSYLAGDDYSIADVATYPWTMPRQQELHRIDIDLYPHVKRWADAVASRPAVQRGVALMDESMKVGNPTDEAYETMFGARQLHDNQ